MLREGAREHLELMRILKPIFDFMDDEKENMDETMLEHKASKMMLDPRVIKSRMKRNNVFLQCETTMQG